MASRLTGRLSFLFGCWLWAGGLCLGSGPLLADTAADIFPLHQVQPGMKGYAATIFSGQKIETFELEVVGVRRGEIEWASRGVVHYSLNESRKPARVLVVLLKGR